MEEEKCKHELEITEENWMGESVMATTKCKKCDAKFEGLLIKK